MREKMRVGIFKFTSCSGCQMVLVHMEEKLLDLLGLVDLRYFRMATDDDFPNGSLDVALVEGAITNDEEASLLKRIRKSTRTLVAAGACAVTGGINTMKNATAEGEVEKVVYPSPETIRSGKAFGLNEYVTVDAYLNGCPVDRSETAQAIISLVLQVPPYAPGVPVCVECKMNENECLFLTRKEPCMGPVTKGGCEAICPSNNVACDGCRGILIGTNMENLTSAWKNSGINPERTHLKLRKYGAASLNYSNSSR